MSPRWKRFALLSLLLVLGGFAYALIYPLTLDKEAVTNVLSKISSSKQVDSEQPRNQTTNSSSASLGRPDDFETVNASLDRPGDFDTGKPSDDRQVAFELATRRFQSRLSSSVDDKAVSYTDLQQQKREVADLLNHPTKPNRVLNSVRIPKAGSSFLSVIARALAGCHPDGFPCCKGRGSPPGSCPRTDLHCPNITGCVDHRPKYVGDEPVITTFRHPESRLLSAFFYWPPHRPKPRKDHRWSVFEEYIRSPKYRNVMTKMSSTGDYAYHDFVKSQHTVTKAKARLCNGVAWFGMADFPILSPLLLYEAPEFAQLQPNPVVFGLPAEDKTQQEKEKDDGVLKKGSPIESSDGLRENDDEEYKSFRETTFLERNGTGLINEYNQEDLELYEFAQGLFCARLQEAGILEASRQAGIATKEIAQCSKLGQKNVGAYCG